MSDGSDLTRHCIPILLSETFNLLNGACFPSQLLVQGRSTRRLATTPVIQTSSAPDQLNIALFLLTSVFLREKSPHDSSAKNRKLSLSLPSWHQSLTTDDCYFFFCVNRKIYKYSWYKLPDKRSISTNDDTSFAFPNVIFFEPLFFEMAVYVENFLVTIPTV